MGGTARDQILTTIHRIAPSDGDTFSPQDVIDELVSTGTDIAESTIRTHVVSRMCGDAPNNLGTTYDDLERVARGLYRLRQR